jgi:thymidylate synthase
MYVINARNAHQALPMGLSLLQKHGIREETRAGPVLRYPGPVTTVLSDPQERVVFHPWRDANPFFHIVEAAWMLAGRNDLKSLTPYVARMKDFSDDGGVTMPGAYGKRWRDWFTSPPQIPDNDGPHEITVPSLDQLNWTVRRLRTNPNDRRVVIQMWDARNDPEAADNNSADVPCNLSMIPWVMNNALHLSIFNRSNDIIWGLYGANAVHFSVVLEYLAGRLGLGVGAMTTFSNNFHAYTDKIPSDKTVEHALYRTGDPYCDAVEPFSLLDGKAPDTDIMRYVDESTRDRVMQEDLKVFFDEGALACTTKTVRWPWLRRVLVPMALAHQRFKGPRVGRYAGTLSILKSVQASDWRRAAEEWIIRRRDKTALHD